MNIRALSGLLFVIAKTGKGKKRMSGKLRVQLRPYIV